MAKDIENQRLIGEHELNDRFEPEIRYRTSGIEQSVTGQSKPNSNNAAKSYAKHSETAEAKRKRVAAEEANGAAKANRTASNTTAPRAPPDDDDPLYRLRLISKREVLRLIGCSATTLWAMQREGRCPLSVRVGSRVYFHLHEVEAWLAKLPRSEYRDPDKKQ
jgi:predicted DNA-binding transcriptional regulator AlpA